jgi:hypothetical protein
MEFDFGLKNITLTNARAKIIHIVHQKLNGFFGWFKTCQYLCIEDMKVPVRQLKRDSKIPS